MAEEFIKILHNNDSITTLAGFMDEYGVTNSSAGNGGVNPKPDSGVINKGFSVTFTPNDLLNYEDNAASILGSYTDQDLEQTNVAIITLLRAPTEIKVPKSFINHEYYSLGGNLIVPTKSVPAFIGDKIRKITLDKDFIAQKNTVDPATNTFRISNNVSVWIYCKALGTFDEDGQLFNLTPFIHNLNTNVGDNGGNFTINLSPVIAEYVKSVNGKLNESGDTTNASDKSKWMIKRSSIDEFNKGSDNPISNIISRESLHKNDINGGIRRNDFFFNKVISQNDLIFIRFETLEIEKDRQKDFEKNGVADQFRVDSKELPNKIYDMIGLVDTNSITFNPASADVNIEIGGRDLMKLLIEDGQYFFPTDFAQSVAKSNQVNKTFQRLVTGQIPFFSLYLDQFLSFPLRFIFNCLSNTEVVPSSLFSFYQNTRNSTSSDPYDVKTTRYEYSLTGNEKELKNIDAAGIWGIIKLVIDPQVVDRKIVDSSIASDSGSILNFINKVCQKPFVEFFGDTYLDKYAFIVRKPPFDEIGFMNNKFIDNGNKDGVNNQDFITIGGVISYIDTLSFNDSEVYSWYRLVPKGNFFGDETTTLFEFPIIFFEEYAKIWGSRPMEVISNYINYQGYLSGKKVTLNYLLDQATQDLGWLIETHALLPFTRKGTIRMKGDRRIKRGMTVRLEETGELFYVDAVSQSYSISDSTTDRETTLTVSRGIVEKYAKQYFNIIDLNKDSSGKCGDRTKFNLNKDIFNFFLKRRQFQ